MVHCPICAKPIPLGAPAVQLSGGFFQQYEQSGPPVFVPEDEVMVESFIHKECLDTMVKADIKTNRAH